LTAAVSLISIENSSGVFFSAENTPIGNVKLIVLDSIFPPSFAFRSLINGNTSKILRFKKIAYTLNLILKIYFAKG
jgi:hypothetical protein